MKESAVVKYRNAALALTAVVAAVAFSASLGPPRALWLNAGMTIAHEWTQGAAALVAAAALAGMAGILSHRGSKAAALVGAAALAVFGAHRLSYRVNAVDDALSLRNVLGTTRIPWKAVTRMDAGPGHLTVVSDATVIRVGTAGLSADEKAALERTVSRRMREADASRPPAGPEKAATR